MVEECWRESSENGDEASDTNLHEDGGLVGIEEFRVHYPMNVGDASTCQSFTSQHVSLAVPMVQMNTKWLWVQHELTKQKALQRGQAYSVDVI